MPDQGMVIVTNTTPLIALAAATGNLDVLRTIYTRVVVPYEVAEEIRAGGKLLLVWMCLTRHRGWKLAQNLLC
jgi:predicted nucleic acid-binding protein